MKKLPDEQMEFLHGNDMRLEMFARSISDDKYYGSVNWTDIKSWQSFYLETLDIIQRSIFRCIGYVDPSHKRALEETIAQAMSSVKAAKRKDAIHSALIVSLFKIIFLLLGRLPYNSRNKIRSFSSFRTLTYCQTEEQLSYLLQSEVESNYSNHGFTDSFDASYAFSTWAKMHKVSRDDRSAYVKWVALKFPETYNRFH